MPLKKNVRHFIGDMLRRVGALPSDGFPRDAWGQRGFNQWFESHKVTPEELAVQRATKFDLEPKFSFIVPLYKTPLDYLEKMVVSVLQQSYGNFELVLVNASPEMEMLAGAVEAICSLDDRVVEVRLDGNYGITENTNRGIAVATGDFLSFMDHDDFIEPDLLFEYVRAINENPDIDVLYCDEDLVEVSADGKVDHVHPLFKPAYSPELLLCKNYIVHLMTIRADIVHEMPTPDATYDGAQDYNMVLYATSAARAIKGVQRILYHWRMSEQSTAAKPHAKPYSQRAYRKSAFNRISSEYPNGKIIGSGIINIHNVWFELDEKAPRVSMIVDCGSEETTDADLQAFKESFDQTNSYENVEMILTEPQANTYARLNAAARKATGEYLFFVSAEDTILTADSIEQLLGLCMNPRIGAVAAKVLYVDYTLKNYGIAVTNQAIMPLNRGFPDEFPAYQCNLRAFQNYSAVSWEGMMVQREDYLAAGGFCEEYESLVGAADFCHRLLENGLRIVQVPTVKMQTSEKAPEKPFDSAGNAHDFSSLDVVLFDETWPGVLEAGDPYFNSNFDQASEYYRFVG